MKWLKFFILFVFVGASAFFFWPRAPHQPKVYDCFLFYNELELLEIRLNELNDYVDKFVIVEACETFRGKPKPFYFEENKQLFEKFADKIIHIQIKEPFKTDNPWKRERHQRSQAALGLKDGHPEDIVFISDLDEIMRGSTVPGIVDLISSKKADAAICLQTMYHGFLNRRQAENWRGSVATTMKKIKAASPALIRRQRNMRPRKMERAKISKIELIPNAGWHFTTMGGLDRTILKIESVSHDECDTPEYKNRQRLLEEFKSYTLKPVDESFPKYIRDHKKHFEEIGFLDTN